MSQPLRVFWLVIIFVSLLTDQWDYAVVAVLICIWFELWERPRA
jgi:hypothetical protein